MAAQLALYDRHERCNPQTSPATQARRRRRSARAPLCASCQAREARYGFRSEVDDPLVERPRTLCFECFRVEMVRRQESARAVQARLPLERTLDALDRRRRRAQIAARRALGLR